MNGFAAGLVSAPLSFLLELHELFQRIRWIRERRVGVRLSLRESWQRLRWLRGLCYGAEAGALPLLPQQGLRGPAPRKGHRPLTLFFVPLVGYTSRCLATRSFSGGGVI